MPLVKLSDLNINPDLIVDVADEIVGGTVVKRKVEVIELKYSPKLQRVHIEVSVIPYSTTGERLQYGAVPGYLIADNTTLVKEDGTILGNRIDLLGGDEFMGTKTEDPSLAGINYMGEYDFFKIMAKTKSVVVDDLIKFKIISKYGAPA